MKILYIITGLELGGAENSLLRLLMNIDKTIKPSVISLTTEGTLSQDIKALNIPYKNISFTSTRSKIFSLILLIKEIKEQNPDIIHTWLYHADLIGSLAAFFSNKKNIIWSIRNNEISEKTLSKSTYIVALICSYLSYLLPKKIIYNSKKNMQSHHKFGYSYKKSYIIPNGIPFTDQLENKDDIFKLFGLNQSCIYLAFVARFDPVKEHITFLNSFENIIKANEKIVALLAGKGVDYENSALNNIIKKKKLENNVVLMGEQKNVNLIYSICELTILPSISESFPNVLAESMIKGTPCVATNVGEVSEIIGPYGYVVDLNNIDDFNNSIIKYLNLSKEEKQFIKDNAKKRILDNYSLNKCIKAHKKVYEEILNKDQ